MEAPLAACARRLQEYSISVWPSADILLITDSKVEPPSTELTKKLEALRREGLRLFALIVVQEDSLPGMKALAQICDEASGSAFELRCHLIFL